MPSTKTMLAFVLIPLLALTTWGCASCRDHLLISVQDAESREALVGADIEFRPVAAHFPPAVWRGRTDSNGELRICVDFGRVALAMSIYYNDEKVLGRTLYDSMFDGRDTIEVIAEPPPMPSAASPRVRVVVQRLDR